MPLNVAVGCPVPFSQGKHDGYLIMHLVCEIPPLFHELETSITWFTTTVTYLTTTTHR